MSITQADYEALLCQYSHRQGAIALLKQFRPYLEMIPSMRRPEQSLITIPLPLIRLRRSKQKDQGGMGSIHWRETIPLPCDLAILMCDPEWKIKMGGEIMIFIHRPGEDFSQLLTRWRKTQIYLDQDYEWLMPIDQEHMFSEGAEHIYPLFIVFEKTPPRIKKALAGACLPFLSQIPHQELISVERPEVLTDNP